MPDNFDPEINYDHPKVTQNETITLKQVSFFKNGFKFKHSEKLNGMFSMYLIFSTKQYDEATLYNNWDFATP